MAQRLCISEAEQILGLTGTYTHKDLQSAYRQKIKHAHPDVGGSAEEATRINNAKDVLEELFKYDPARIVTCTKGSSGRASTSNSPTSGSATQGQAPYQSDSVSSDSSTQQRAKTQESRETPTWEEEPAAEPERPVSTAPPKPPLRIRTWFVCLLCWLISGYVVAPALLIVCMIGMGLNSLLSGFPDALSANIYGFAIVLVAIVCNVGPILIGRRIARKKQKQYWEQCSNS